MYIPEGYGTVFPYIMVEERHRGAVQGGSQGLSEQRERYPWTAMTVSLAPQPGCRDP